MVSRGREFTSRPCSEATGHSASSRQQLSDGRARPPCPSDALCRRHGSPPSATFLPFTSLQRLSQLRPALATCGLNTHVSCPWGPWSPQRPRAVQRPANPCLLMPGAQVSQVQRPMCFGLGSFHPAQTGNTPWKLMALCKALSVTPPLSRGSAEPKESDGLALLAGGTESGLPSSGGRQEGTLPRGDLPGVIASLPGPECSSMLFTAARVPGHQHHLAEATGSLACDLLSPLWVQPVLACKPPDVSWSPSLCPESWKRDSHGNPACRPLRPHVPEATEAHLHPVLAPDRAQPSAAPVVPHAARHPCPWASHQNSSMSCTSQGFPSGAG
ncbi:uncharacterized protein LOC102475985 [Tupaia chinensis]|uniref:uncharacterized protein LOC102475985 n=1 Tax=Tupaia chinensis TaxID=246437 RepID=UPI00070435C3|nr:uncharacterized protein LOC102475985 [Tupaia chinensis]